MEQNRNEWVMHVWGKKRDTLELTETEKFHIYMLDKLKDRQMKFDKILVNIALDEIDDMDLFNFLKEEIGKVLVNDNVEFKYCQNDRKLCEYVTFRPHVFDRIGEDVNVFYSHFKGYNSFVKVKKESYPARITGLCSMFWSYIMYMYSLNMYDVKNKLKDHSVYGWYVLKIDEETDLLNFFNKYCTYIQDGDERLKEGVADNLHKHCPGSFMWYNLKRIGEVLKDKPYVTDISDEYILKQSEKNKVNLCTHFCESYLMNYLPADECYSVNDFNKEFLEMVSTLYAGIYPSKKIGREYLKDFEKYLIDNELI